MIFLENTLISDELKTVCFCCDLDQCKGACCVEGDAGAPLEEAEVSLLEDHLPEIRPYMTPAGIEEVERCGVFDYDAAANLVTPLAKGRECAFAFTENGVARCAIEKAFEEGKITFRKPLSCHLYPVRISRLKEHEAVNYHRWNICRKAVEKGEKEKIPLYRFLEASLIRKFGSDWYRELLIKFD
ncbi:MAG TPA: DUF3109 family protein [Bacteroidales bacterium]|nr:DUF3109 family protein [Bacteroidales bacterium]